MSFQTVLQRVIDDDAKTLEDGARHLRQAGTAAEAIETMCNIKRATDYAIKELKVLLKYSVIEEGLEFKIEEKQ